MTNKEFKEWLDRHRLTNAEFARISRYSADYISKMVTGRKPVTNKIIEAMKNFEMEEKIKWKTTSL